MRALTREQVAGRKKFVPGVSVWMALNLFDRRARAKLTQGELARKAGISYRRYQSIETASTDNITIKTLCALAAVLKVDVRDLLKPRKDYVRV